MKILRIEIAAFGKWRQQTFHFISGNQLIYGENEAGKSTIYQFIQAMLFGFPSKGKKKKDYMPKDGAAYGGKIWLEHSVHGEIIVERYKQQNRGKAKVLFKGQVGGDELLEKLLSPLSKDLFQQVFTFQQEQLTELDHLREKELHDALISLGITGSSHVFQKRQNYYQKAQQLFKKKGQKLIINQKLNEWKNLQEKVRQKQKQESFFSQLVQQEQNYEQKQAIVQKKLKKINRKIFHIKQQKLNYSLYEEWQELKVNTLSQVPEETLLSDLGEFIKRYQQMAERLDELEATLEKHSGMDQQSARYYFYLEQEQVLKELQNQQSSIENWVNEWQRLQVERREIESELKILEQRWHWQRTQTPQEFFHRSEWQQLFSDNQLLNDHMSQLMIRAELVFEQQHILEEEVNKIENTYPELLQTNKSKAQPIQKMPLYILISLFFVLSLLIPMPWKIAFFTIVLGIIGYQIYRGKDINGKKSTLLEIKGMWQEKLGQLDNVLLQIEEINQSKQNITNEQQRLQKQVLEFSAAFHLGTMDTLETMKEYGQEVSDYQNLYEQLLKKQERTNQIQHKLVEFDRQFEVMKDWLPLQDKKIIEKMMLLSNFIQEMEQLKFARSYQQNTLLKQEINQLKKKQKVLLLDYSKELKQAELTYPSEVPAYLQKAKQTKIQLRRLKELDAQLAPLFPKKQTYEQLNTGLSNYQEKQRHYQLEEQEIIEQRQRLKIQVEELQKDGTLDELYQEASLLKTQLQLLFEQWGGLMVAATFLGDISTEMSERQLPQLLKAAGYYLEILTHHNYQNVSLINNTLTLTDGITDFPIYELSTGTKDQLIMAMRFAYLSLESQRVICPIIIDDGWLHYDHQRKYQLAKLLAEFSQNYQVICFSSDQEMVSYYQELQQSVNRLKGVNNEKNS
ncbi:AAA family ATPase [Enterococcus ratti]|uniref:AAA family ATPase n=1 Tax=Enterococcus ratti TaxID=150033 RepID=UPI0009003116|nr:AAA family ATPase [Enterococcus ratti]